VEKELPCRKLHKTKCDQPQKSLELAPFSVLFAAQKFHAIDALVPFS
jgi:hypothetical protein